MKYLFLSILFLTGCTAISERLNPFNEEISKTAKLGKADDSAISGGSDKSANARTALDALSTYQSANMPQPYNPVLRPAIVRLMWVPDHLNTHGDLVPNHYYYLKVKDDQWALQDAFDIDQQLGSNTASGSIPYRVNTGPQ